MKRYGIFKPLISSFLFVASFGVFAEAGNDDEPNNTTPGIKLNVVNQPNGDNSFNAPNDQEAEHPKQGDKGLEKKLPRWQDGEP